jgi:hypothetical protein
LPAASAFSRSAASSAASAPSTSVHAAQLIAASGRSSAKASLTAPSIERHDLVIPQLGRPPHVLAEHPARAGDQELHGRRDISCARMRG